MEIRERPGILPVSMKFYEEVGRTWTNGTDYCRDYFIAKAIRFFVLISITI